MATGRRICMYVGSWSRIRVARHISSSSKKYITKSQRWKAPETVDAQLSIENEETGEDEPSFKGQLYDEHIPTTFFQKSLLSFGSAVMALTDSSRDDMIATLGETTGYVALKVIKQKMESDPTGRQILEERPRINSRTVDLNRLRNLPEGTFGKEYINFLDDNRVFPDARLPVHFVDDQELAYVMQRYREVHDLYHVILGMPTHMLGEVVVKWVEAFQTGLPMCILGALAGPVKLWPKQSQKYWDTHFWWAIETGRNADFLMNLYFEKHWETSLEDLRALLNISPPPTTPAKLWKESSSK